MTKISGTNTEFTRSYNRRVVFDIIRRSGPISRTKIAEITRLKLQTISNISKEFEDSGYIKKTGRAYGGRGQPPVNYVMNPDVGFSIGIHLEKNHLSGVLTNLNHQIYSNYELEYEESTIESIFEALLLATEKLIQEAKVDKQKIWGIGLVAPRLSDEDLQNSTKLEDKIWVDFHSFQVEKKVEQEIGLPIFLENDATASAIAEKQYGVAQEIKNFCQLFLGWGLGCGIIQSNYPFRGQWGNAGEVGRFLIPNPDDPTQMEFVENVISLRGLEKLMNDKGKKLDSLKMLEPLYQKKDAILMKWIDHSAYYLRWLINVLENAFDPETIILGGYLPQAIFDELIQKTQPFYLSISDHKQRNHPRLMRAHLLEDSAKMGAATLPIFAVSTPHSDIQTKGKKIVNIFS